MPDITLGEEPITTFRQALTRVADLAHAKLPAELHGHLERAVALVTNRHVWMDEDGRHAQVLSSDGQTLDGVQGRLWYVCNGHCTCMGVSKAPQGLCKHRLSVMLYRRASDLLAQSRGPLPLGEGRSTPAAEGTTCPEALFSACLKGTVGGIDTMVTVRGQTLEEFRTNLEAVRQLFDPPQARPALPTSAPAQPAQTSGETPMCLYHGAMKESTKVKGTFFCPSKMGDGSYCKEKFPKK